MRISNKIFIEEILVLLSFLVIFLNYEFNLFQIVSDGEKLRNSFVMILGDKFEKNYTSLYIPLNLFDIIFLLSFIYIIFFRKNDFYNYFLSFFYNRNSQKILITLLFLFFYMFIILIIKKSNFSNAQFFVQLLHLLKLFQCFIFFLILIFFINHINFERLIKSLIIISFIPSTLGILHVLSIIHIPNVIDNRMTFGGMLILNFSILPLLALFKGNSIYSNKFWKFALFFSIFLSVLFCLMCGKRAIYLITIMILISLIAVIFIYRKNFFRQTFFLISVFIISFTSHLVLPKIESEYKKFFEAQDSNILSSMPINILTKTFPEKGVPVGHELYPQDRFIVMNMCKFNEIKTFLKEIKFLMDSEFKNLTHYDLDCKIMYTNEAYQKLKRNGCFLLKMDHSTVIRLTKHVRSVILLQDSFLGIGFWGTQYIYDFLPDSILQFFLEIGLIGMILFFIIIFYIIKYLKKENLIGNVLDVFPIILIFILFSSLSFFSLILYEWRYLILMTIFTYLIVKKTKLI